MQVSIVNFDAAIANDELLTVVRAINVQIERDFQPYWHKSARLRVDSRDPKMSRAKLTGLRGDAILYIVRDPDEELAGFHELHHAGVPFGYVFTSLSEALSEPWTVTLSHEALELLADPECNLMCKGPHPDPAEHRRHVFHWLEVCDPVQAEHYPIDGVQVSNFVLPPYYTGGEELDGRNDFLVKSSDSGQLRSFSVNPGGYVGFYDPRSGENCTYEPSALAQARAKLKKGRVPARFRRADRRDHDFPLSSGVLEPNAAEAGKKAKLAKTVKTAKTASGTLAKKRGK